MSRNTKIVATYGPSIASREGVVAVLEAGVDVIRLNFSHGEYSQHEEAVGYVLADELDTAFRCGERALELAIELNDQQIAKNCLFLLSEIAVRRGDTCGARRYLHELTAYSPEAGISEEIIDVFLATDLTTVVNLRG